MQSYGFAISGGKLDVTTNLECFKNKVVVFGTEKWACPKEIWFRPNPFHGGLPSAITYNWRGQVCMGQTVTFQDSTVVDGNIDSNVWLCGALEDRRCWGVQELG